MRKRPDGYIRKRSKNSFEIRYSLGVNPLTGKRKRIETTFKGTYDQAKVELRRLLRTIDTNEHVETTKIKVKEFLTEWLKTIGSQVSPKTHERYTDLVNHFIIPALGSCLLIRLTPSNIQLAYN